MKNVAGATVAVLILSACVSARTPTSDVRAIGLCNAGVTTESSAKVTAKVEERIRDGVALDAVLKDEIKGMFMSKTTVSEQHAVQLYERYIQCIETQQKKFQEEKAKNATSSS